MWSLVRMWIRIHGHALPSQLLDMPGFQGGDTRPVDDLTFFLGGTEKQWAGGEMG
jgi:hypothetical protein